MISPTVRPLRATYRLQVHKDFTLANVRAIVPYLAELGVSHVYTSPILTARPGSTHGYDVTDPKAINPEIGGEDALRALVRTLHEHDMGYLLDIVPNHMGTGSSNPYWEDMLANGRKARYAHWFDVDWDVPDPALNGRVLLPVLGDELDAVIERGELSIGRGDGGGDPRVRYFDNSFPLSPETLAEIDDGEIAGKGAEPVGRIRGILDRQHYSLVSWRRASKDINYRRFFDINDLVALRMEDPRVFVETHARILELVADGSLDGLRIDHIDGLLDPQGYLDRLRAEVTNRRGADFPIFVEKILSPGEQLREQWPVQGTTGYEILNDLESAFIEADGFASIEDGYRKLLRPSGAELTFEQVAIEGKLRILRGALNPDIARLTRLLLPISKGATRMATHGGAGRGHEEAEPDAAILEEAIVELTACMPVYRTYLDGEGHCTDADSAVLDRAFSLARERGRASPDALELLAEVMRPGAMPDDPDEHEARSAFIRRFQQTSGPATAKGVEDTALYIYVPLVSRNEVGGAPDRPLGSAVRTLHDANAIRATSWPLNLVCTNTHDTKRSADVRARLDVLAEMPDQWMRSIRRWRMLNRGHRISVGRRFAPDPNTEYLFYQALLGVWPIGLANGELPVPEIMDGLHERLEAYMLKAVKEGKSRTSWTDPDEEFEAALKKFIHTVLFRSPTFISDFAALAARLSRPGLWNALSRTVLHLTVPGVPDIYQGDEQWGFSLVDPDNRRPVDYDARRRMLEELDLMGQEEPDHLAAMVASPENGRVKTHVVRSVLHARREQSELFSEGAYVPLEASGAGAEHVIAFARTNGDAAAITLVPRLSASLVGGWNAPVGNEVWGETALVLPRELGERRWVCAFSGRKIDASGNGDGLPVGVILESLPVALLLPVAT